MSWNITVRVHDVPFVFCSEGGVLVQPGLHNLQDEHTLMALREAISIYEDARDVFNADEEIGSFGVFRISGDENRLNLIREQQACADTICELCQKALKQHSISNRPEIAEFVQLYERAKQPPIQQPKKAKAKRVSQHGYVYLIQSSTGFYKIGRAKKLKERISTLGVKLPFEIEVAHSIECDDYEGMESYLHAEFASKRVNGEWFSLTADEVAWIKSITTDKDLAP